MSGQNTADILYGHSREDSGSQHVTLLTMTSSCSTIRTDSWFEGRCLMLLSSPIQTMMPVSRTVLIVQPPGPEQARCYRLLRELATALAASGTPVMRIELSGTGQSAASLPETQLADWHEDVGRAAEELHTRWPDAALIGLGVRFGARLLLDALSSHQPPLTAFVGWSPLFSGRDWVKHLHEVDTKMRATGQQLDPSDLAGQAWPSGLLAAIEPQIDMPSILAESTLLLDADSRIENISQYNQIDSDIYSSEWCSDSLPMLMSPGVFKALRSLLSEERQPAHDALDADSDEHTDSATRLPHREQYPEHPFCLGGLPVATLAEGPNAEPHDQGLFGVYREGTAASPVVVMLNSGLLGCSGPYGLYVEIAERLAATGIASARFDFSGKGESARKALSGQQAMLDDYAQLCDFLRLRGHQQTVLLGICSGADDALEIAQTSDNVAGLILLDGYAPKTLAYRRHYLQERITSPRRMAAWVARRSAELVTTRSKATPTNAIELRRWESADAMQTRYREVLDARCATLAVFTGALQHDYYNHSGQLSRALGSPPNLSEHYYPEMSHLYPASSQRQELIEQISQWTRSAFSVRDVS